MTRSQNVAAAVLLLAATLLLSWNLGAYPFWGDEADTVIFAEAIWRTGDMDARHGDNLYAYRNGSLLIGFKNRATPPLGYYLVAPFYGMFGESRIALRMPFVLCGVVTVGVVLLWLRREGASAALTLLVGGAVVFNVSFLLYARQCRYYALGTLLATATAYFYRYYDGTRRSRVPFVGGLCLLAATQYLNFAALVAALGGDYLLWRRRERPLTARDWTAIVMPTLLVVAALAAVYNPLDRHNTEFTEQRNWFVDKLTLLAWTLRDLNLCEVGVGPVMLLAPLVALWRGDSRLMRLFVAGVVFLGATVLLSPQKLDATVVEADVRYLAPLTVLGPVLTVLTLYELVGSRLAAAAPLVVLCVFTNVLNVPWNPTAWRSTPYEYLHELRHPRRTATDVLASWLNENVKPDSTVWLTPNEWVAPQILAAPQMRYAWQLKEPVAPEYEHLPAWHVYRREPVDVLVVLGMRDELRKAREKLIPALTEEGHIYEPAATLDVYFEDRTRPELIWHWFRDRPYDKDERIFIFRRR